MKVACFFKKEPFKVKDTDACVGVYSSAKCTTHEHNSRLANVVVEKDGYVFFTCETSRGFVLTARHYDPSKVCAYIIGGKFAPNKESLGERFKDVTIVFADEYDSFVVTVKDEEFELKKIEAPKAKKAKGKKNDSVNVSKQGKSSKANKSS